MNGGGGAIFTKSAFFSPCLFPRHQSGSRQFLAQIQQVLSHFCCTVKAGSYVLCTLCCGCFSKTRRSLCAHISKKARERKKNPCTRSKPRLWRGCSLSPLLTLFLWRLMYIAIWTSASWGTLSRKMREKRREEGLVGIRK